MGGTTVECNTAVVAGSLGANAAFGAVTAPCQTANGGYTAAANLDPPFGSTFPTNGQFPAASTASGAGIGADTKGYYTAGAANSMVGFPLAQQTGWGGAAANLPIGLPPTATSVWGVHTTPATYAGVANAAGTTGVVVSFVLGSYSANLATPTGGYWVTGTTVNGPGSAAAMGTTATGQTSAGSFVPAAAVTATVSYATSAAGVATATPMAVTPTCVQYLRVYPNYVAMNLNSAGPAAVVPQVCYLNGNNQAPGTTGSSASVAAGAAGSCTGPADATVTTPMSACNNCSKAYSTASAYNYLSPISCHFTLPSLTPATQYFYAVAATVTGSTSPGTASGAYTTPASLGTLSFRAPPLPSPQPAGAGSAYPFVMGVMADVGVTYNSSLTAQYMARLGANTPGGLSMIVNVGDFTYGDDFGPSSTFYGSSSGGSNVMKWDMWASMWQPVTGSALLVNAVGNHEMESLNGFNYNPSAWTDGPTTYGWAKASDTVYGGLNAPYQGYAARFPNGAQAPTSYGDIWSSFYYSQNIGPVHVLVINNFVPFAPGTAQYNFAVADLAAVNRVATPWLLVVFHSPPYHTYNTHYKEMDVRAQRISAAACAFRFHLPDAPHRSASWRCTSRCSTSTASTLCSTATCTRTSARTPCTSTSPTPAAPSTSPWVR